MVRQLLFDEAVSLAEVGVNALILIVVELVPLVVLDADLHYLALHSKGFVGVVVDDGQNGFDVGFLEDVGTVEDIDSAEVEVALLCGRLLLLLVDYTKYQLLNLNAHINL